ncbi:MAG: uracil-DNA glycosylase [Steroidobacteraceae bacterium]|jgi:uracil-DNA glycosylase family 4|nr:uracil-DNA glycosylase [Steroidobacteraceae bacterium]
MTERLLYDPDCRRCPRLAAFRDEVKAGYPDYWCRPVPAFGDPKPRILMVGLAPGMHGANRTGRPFTGDYAGILLYETLHALGIGSRPESVAADDPLRLSGLRITNSVKCLPPANKPNPDEIARCNAYLRAELEVLPSVRVLVALGRIAHDAALDALSLKRASARFAHGAEHVLAGGRTLLDSYHCSRYNTNTRRLTPQMFRDVLSRAVELAAR